MKLCEETVRTLTGLWVCIRPFHGGDHPLTDKHRRSKGMIPSVDKHVMVKEENK